MHAPNELDLIYRSIVQWAAPLVILGILHYLQKISTRLQEISESLATIVVRVEVHQKKIEEHDQRFNEHGQRLTSLERATLS